MGQLTRQEQIELSNLHAKLKNKQATKADKLRYLDLLLKRGDLTDEKYQLYKQSLEKDNNNDKLIEYLLAIGAVALLGFLLSKLFKE